MLLLYCNALLGFNLLTLCSFNFLFQKKKKLNQYVTFKKF